MATDANVPERSDRAPERDASTVTKSQRRKAAVASTIGTTIEWYDFFLYGTAAALVFPQVFFPGESTLAGAPSSFRTPFRGCAGRPVGGALFRPSGAPLRR